MLKLDNEFYMNFEVLINFGPIITIINYYNNIKTNKTKTFKLI